MRKMDQVMENARGRELIDALDEERRKVEAFHRELPLCLQLINQTIEGYKQLVLRDERSRYELAVKEMALSSRPAAGSRAIDSTTRSDQQDPPPVAPEKPVPIRATKNWGEALDMDLEKEEEDINDALNGDGREHGTESSHGEEIKKGSRRKARRFWSEELHKRFIQALEQLGGCDAATPKHIRKLMKVDELTNDEVKSHLQKFRLHARRSMSSSGGGQGMNSNDTNPQFVVAVRGIWIPTPDCTIVTSATAPAIGTQAQTGRSHQAPPLPLLPSPLIFWNQSCQQQQHTANYKSQ